VITFSGNGLLIKLARNKGKLKKRENQSEPKTSLGWFFYIMLQENINKILATKVYPVIFSHAHLTLESF